MKIEKYPVTVGEESLTYKFISKGRRGKVAKVVIYSKTSVYNMYNLGFGDENLGTGDIDDNIVTDNGDGEKVLATVADTLYVFTARYPGVMVFVTGTSKARIRLYRMGINNNYEQIIADFELFGFLENGWQPFEKQGDYTAFLVLRKKK